MLTRALTNVQDVDPRVKIVKNTNMVGLKIREANTAIKAKKRPKDLKDITKTPDLFGPRNRVDNRQGLWLGNGKEDSERHLMPTRTWLNTNRETANVLQVNIEIADVLRVRHAAY